MLGSLQVFSSRGAGGPLAVPPAAGGDQERHTLNIRKIAVVGSFAAGAALALAPLASADTPITSTIDSEITSLNSLFTDEADLAGIKAGDILGGTTPGSFEYINPSDVAADAPKTAPFSTLDYELYGVAPGVAGVSSDSGAYDLYNGASGEFYDAYNVGLYALENGGALAPSGDVIATGASTAALGTDSVSGAITTFLEAGANDLSGYLDLPALFTLP